MRFVSKMLLLVIDCCECHRDSWRAHAFFCPLHTVSIQVSHYVTRRSSFSDIHWDSFNNHRPIYQIRWMMSCTIRWLLIGVLSGSSRLKNFNLSRNWQINIGLNFELSTDLYPTCNIGARSGGHWEKWTHSFEYIFGWWPANLKPNDRYHSDRGAKQQHDSALSGQIVWKAIEKVVVEVVVVLTRPAIVSAWI